MPLTGLRPWYSFGNRMASQLHGNSGNTFCSSTAMACEQAGCTLGRIHRATVRFHMRFHKPTTRRFACSTHPLRSLVEELSKADVDSHGGGDNAKPAADLHNSADRLLRQCSIPQHDSNETAAA